MDMTGILPWCPCRDAHGVLSGRVISDLARMLHVHGLHSYMCMILKNPVAGQAIICRS